MRRTMHVDGENPIVSRITEQLINQRKTQKQLMKYIGGTQGMYSEWKSGRIKSYERYIDKIADFLNVSKSYLLTGYDEDPDELELLRIYRGLSKDKKAELLSVARTI